jgi:hypothetical protein
LATHCCFRPDEKLIPGFCPVSNPSVHSPHFSGNQYAPRFLERRKIFIEEKPSREYLSNEFGKLLSVLGYLSCIFDLIVMLKLFFIPTIDFTYPTSGALPIMCYPMSRKRPFFECSFVPGQPSEQ